MTEKETNDYETDGQYNINKPGSCQNYNKSLRLLVQAVSLKIHSLIFPMEKKK